jgi:hypothetical protein
MCIDYRKLNSTTRNDHFPLLFIEQMLYEKMVQMNSNFIAFKTQATKHMHNMSDWMSDMDRRVHDVWHLTQHLNDWHINRGDYQQPRFSPYQTYQRWFTQAPRAPHEGDEPRLAIEAPASTPPAFIVFFHRKFFIHSFSFFLLYHALRTILDLSLGGYLDLTCICMACSCYCC